MAALISIGIPYRLGLFLWKIPIGRPTQTYRIFQSLGTTLRLEPAQGQITQTVEKKTAVRHVTQEELSGRFHGHSSVSFGFVV